MFIISKVMAKILIPSLLNSSNAIFNHLLLFVSKSKVFVGKISPEWKSVVEKWNLFTSLKDRLAINFEIYEKLHRKQLETSVNPSYKGFGLTRVEKESSVLQGARYYSYQK